ncbi:35085_t:CDS:1, partial [Gigaspora margarita]
YYQWFLTVSPVKCKFCVTFNGHLSMDFYSISSVENWTSGRIIEHYQMKLKGNRTKILDSIKKDLQKVVVSTDFDNARKSKAQKIIDQWKIKVISTVLLNKKWHKFLVG